MSKYYHVGVYLGTGAIPNERISEIQGVLSRNASDWLRYAPNCWIVYSTHFSAHVLATELKKALRDKTPQGDDEQVLVFEINWGNYYGWVSELVRDWLARPRY